MGEWIGVDLDGTLAEYRGPGLPIGKPVPVMVARVLAWLAEGKEVRIFTARVSRRTHWRQRVIARGLIELWCEVHLGRELPVTAEKDFELIELWDDRAVPVERNTGLIRRTP